MALTEAEQQQASKKRHACITNKQESDSKRSVLDAYGYQVINTIGSGSYAIVKSAFSKKYTVKVAVKIIQKNKAPKDYIDKFLPDRKSVV